MIKRTLKRMLQKVYWGNHLKEGIRCDYSWYGNEYGGFYVCPSTLTEDSIVYSFGIGEDISFDQSIISKHNCNVFAFDPTPKSVAWIKKQELPSKFKFFDFGLGQTSGEVEFFLPKNPTHVSGSAIAHHNINTGERVQVKMRSIKDIVAELGHKEIDLLKMDIEGSEYEVIDGLMELGTPINQIAIEFHARFFADGRERTKQAIKRMRDHGYEIFAVADSFQEISLIQKRV